MSKRVRDKNSWVYGILGFLISVFVFASMLIVVLFILGAVSLELSVISSILLATLMVFLVIYLAGFVGKKIRSVTR
ncbi:MAG: hypothetical protein ACTSPL_04030 [Candidatus Odinarchaeia archaeon]